MSFFDSGIFLFVCQPDGSHFVNISNCQDFLESVFLTKMNDFLASVERRAYRMAYLATGNRDEALDIVQDAMFKLAQRYADRGKNEWGPLFHRILQSRIRDWYRRARVRYIWQRITGDEAGKSDDLLDKFPDPAAVNPEKWLGDQGAMKQLDKVLRELPLRQQQVFLLRVWEGLDVKETAHAMGCSEGSVKTHYSRAVHKLRERLEEYRS